MKSRHRLFSRLVMLVLLATVLFARVAAAGYVCPSETLADAGTTVASMRCPDMDEAQPALCADHQHDGQHWADSNGHASDIVALPAMAAGSAHTLPPAPPRARHALPAYWRHGPPSPVYLATARLRI
ncbi:hypothetical protein [Ralstonia pickettii]|uniref:hypothetical protein n=1 Tax=Ralstonia pickettii TaxID=329 RepID=UPI0004693805|nr:hypothetical protein [Ralstonia pickettii]